MMLFGKWTLGLVVAVALVSCGRPTSDEQQSKAGGDSSARIVLNRGNGAEPDTLDPQKATGTWESDIIGEMILPLTTEDAAGNPVPGSAESWRTSDDGLVWTFNIRKDMSWSDGVPVTAGDFVYAFRRILDPAFAAQYASLIYVIKNAEKVNTGKAKGEELGVRALDDKTLEITLEHPCAYLLELAKHQTMSPVPKHAVEKFGNSWVKPENIVVNGPYKLVSWVPNSNIKLTKNPRFYDAANVQIDEINFLPINDTAIELKRYQAGEIDITASIPARQLPWATQTFGDQVHVQTYMSVGYEQINIHRPPFTDVRVRRALAMAIDREAIVYKIINAGGAPAYSLVPRGVANYENGPEFDFKKLSMKERQDEARKLLAQAGFGPQNPLRFTYLYMDSPDGKRVAVAIQDMWKAIGVEVGLLSSETKVVYDSLRAQDFDVAAAGWVADYNDAQNFLFLLQSTTGAMNYSKYSNPRYDALIARAEETLGHGQRAELLKQAEAIILADVPLIPISFGAYRNLVAPHIKGWVDNVTDAHRTRYLRIER